jgi:hypothetical protein
MRRDIFYRNTQMKYCTKDKDDAQHFDPEFPRGLNFNSKQLNNWTQGESDYKQRDDAVVTPGGRQTERTRRREQPPVGMFGVLFGGGKRK